MADHNAPGDNGNMQSDQRARTEHLSGLLTYLYQTREEDRRRLARELHDELGSILTAAKLDITFIRSRCAQSNPELVPKCDRIIGMLDQGTELKRRTIDQLRPSTLDMLGLAPAARDLVATFGTRTQITVEVEVDDEIALPTDEALVLFRVLEEALANVERHARATQVRVALRRDGDVVRAAVRDNGAGFDSLATGRAMGGIALLRQRLAVLGGDLVVDSRPGAGAAVEAWLPAP